jgi:hypothetical protein
MKRFVLLLAALAALVPAAPAVAAAAQTGGVNSYSAPAAGASAVAGTTDDVRKIPPELCFAIFGSHFESLVCSR